jgi:hypothetical protein
LRIDDFGNAPAGQARRPERLDQPARERHDRGRK